MSDALLQAGTLWWREITRFRRQRSRVIGSFLQPLVFWLLLGAGLKASFRPAGMPAGMDYFQYLYPGFIVLVLLFTAIFATISTVEDRREGFLQGVLVAPMIPGLNDAEMEKIIEASSRAGARHAGYVLLRLPHELRQMFEDWLATHYPDRAKHVLNLVRETRGGGLEVPRCPTCRNRSAIRKCPVETRLRQAVPRPPRAPAE